VHDSVAFILNIVCLKLECFIQNDLGFNECHHCVWSLIAAAATEISLALSKTF
jgi:hypothetical protein